MAAPTYLTGSPNAYGGLGSAEQRAAGIARVPKQSGLDCQAGDLVLAIIRVGDPMYGWWSAGPPDTHPRAIAIAANNSPLSAGSLTPMEPGWTLAAFGSLMVDYTNATYPAYGAVTIQEQAMWVFAKRITAADMNAPHFGSDSDDAMFQFAPLNYPGYTDPVLGANLIPVNLAEYSSYSAGSAIVVGVRGADLIPGVYTQDAIAPSWLSGGALDTSGRGGIAASTTKTVTLNPADLTVDGGLTDVMAVTVGWSDTTVPLNQTSDGVEQEDSSTYWVATKSSLSGPTINPPDQNSGAFTASAWGDAAVRGLAVSFALKPSNAFVGLDVPVPSNPLFTLQGERLARAHLTVPATVTMSTTGTAPEPVPSEDVDDYVLDWNPVNYWKFNETPASNAVNVTDYGSNPTTLNITGTSTHTVVAGPVLAAGKGPAIRFSSTSANGYWEDGTSAAMFPNFLAPSILGRFVPEANGTIFEVANAFDRLAALDVVNGYVQATVYGRNGDNNGRQVTVTDPSPIVFGAAYTLGLRWDGYKVELIRDGEVVASATPDVPNLTPKPLYNASSTKLYVAGSYALNSKRWKGSINRLAFFNYPLPDSVIENFHILTSSDDAVVEDPPKWGEGQPNPTPADGYALEVISDDPVFYYRLDETNGDAWLRDSSGNDNDMVLTPQVPWLEGGGNPIPSANDRLILQRGSMLPSYGAGKSAKVKSDEVTFGEVTLPLPTGMPTSTAWTIEMIVRRAAAPGLDSLYTNAVKFGVGYTAPYLGINFNGEDAIGVLYDTASYEMVKAVAEKRANHTDNLADPEDEDRYHYVVTCDGDTLTIYEAGVERASVDVSGTTGGAAGGYFANGPGQLLLRINDEVDEIAVYPTALSSSRITAHWLATGLTAPPDATEPPPPPPPDPRGQLLAEYFEGGAVDDEVTDANTGFRSVFYDPETSAAPKFTAAGYEGQGLGMAGNGYAAFLWHDEAPGIHTLYYRGWIKVNGDTGQPGAVGLQFNSYVSAEYESYYEDGIGLCALIVEDDGGTLKVKAATTADLATFTGPYFASITPDTWYLIEAKLAYSAGTGTATMTGRVSEADGTLIAESEPQAVLDLVGLGITGDLNTNKPYGLTFIAAQSASGWTQWDGIGVNDSAWQGIGEPGPEVPGGGPVVRWWDGTEMQGATLLGWYDGTEVQEATLLGWWDGTEVQPVTEE